MRRRPSGSSEEEEDVRSPGTSGAASPSQHGEKSESAVVRSLSTTSRGSMDTKRDADGAATPRSKNAWTRSSKGSSEKELAEMSLSAKELNRGSSREEETRQRIRMRNPWSISWPTLSVVVLACILLLTIIRSFLTRQLDPKGCRMSYMRSAFVHFPEFDTEHTRFATKYNLHLYREVGVDDDARVKGVPVLFIPGNAGSYKQARSLASEAAIYYQNEISHRPDTERAAKLPLDVFTVDFNEDITAFHGQTLLDQAEYLNDAVAFILSLYHNPQRSMRDPSLPDPSSVILIGHSMGGVVARTMLTMPNYQANTINSMVTLSAPHARPPVSFDANIVNTYKKINDYWRSSYSKQWGNENPLWHVTLISIAGGGLDTIVPSDYSSIASLVPETHGFTVFTSTIPGVWTGMDHLAITWCDQLRKSVIHALYEVVDVHQSGQTRRRAERMRTFKKWFLTGLEDVAERTLPQEDPKTLLTLEDSDNAILAQGERLTVRSFGYESKPKAYLMPLPPHNRAEKRRFTLLSDQSDSVIDVMFCSVFPLQPGQSASLFSMDMDLSGDSSGSTRLACKSAMPDLVRLPASRSGSQFPFEETQPFSYLQYELEMLSEYQFVAVVDKATEHRKGFVIAEFGSTSESTIRTNHDLQKLFTTGMQLRLPSSRPISVDIKLPALHSSLLAFNLKVLSHGCGKKNELFQPLLRQYITDVYESRFFVNVKNADINLHGVAPYMPPSFRGKSSTNGLSLQLWTDPTCDTPLDISMHVDIMGSMGKLWMRYRTWFAALPLLIVALALRKQFQVYDKTGR